MNASDNILFSVYSDTCKIFINYPQRKITPKKKIHFVLVKIVQFMTKNDQ